MKEPAFVRSWQARLSCVLLLGLSAAVCPAQSVDNSTAPSAASSADTFHIHGVVLDSRTGKPIARALVVAFGDRLATMTDHDGRFTLDVHFTGTNQASAQRLNITARMIFPSVNVRKPGYTLETSSRFLQAYASDQLEKDFVLKLTPESSIQGRVTASGDDYPEGVRVSLFSRQIQEGASRWVMTGSASTNSQGEFRFGGLAAGDYRLQTQVWSDQPGQSEPGKPAMRYAPVVYPAGSSPAAGPQIHLAAGETLPVNFNLHPETFYPVRIPIMGVETGNGLQARVERDGALSGLNLRYVPRDKAVEGLLPSGSYQVTLQSVGQNAAVATVPLAVGGSAAETAPVSLSPLASIPVTVHEEFTGKEQAVPVRLPGGVAPTVQVLLQPEQMGIPVPMTTPNREDGESMTLERVLPGTYRARVLPYRGYVAAATSGGTDLLSAPLIVTSGSGVAPIEITLRDDSATIEGSLDPSLFSSGAEDNTLSFAYVLCVPAESSSLQPMLSMTRNEGKFLLRNVPPGSYRIYASRVPFDKIEYRSDAFLRANGSKGVPITVEPNASTTVTVTSLLDEEKP